MRNQFDAIPRCLLHDMNVKFICANPACAIPNPFICGHTDCLKNHGTSMHQIVSLSKLDELLQNNTHSLELLIEQTRAYYKEIRQSIAHEIEKVSGMMENALRYKHTHPVINLFSAQKYHEISSQRMSDLLLYLHGTKNERNSMIAIRDEIYEELERLNKNRIKLLDSSEFRKLMLFEKINIHSIKQTTLTSVDTSILTSEEQYQTVISMLSKKFKKRVDAWELLFRASQNQYSAEAYRLSIQGKGPLLMLFQTEENFKFGCFLNCKVDRKDQWLTDGPGLSFIFSLDHNITFPIKQEAKHRVKAAYIGDKGPQIGSGCDIYISDRCNENFGSGSNLGGSFELPSKLFYGGEESKKKLGSTQNFKMREYEIFELL